MRIPVIITPIHVSAAQILAGGNTFYRILCGLIFYSYQLKNEIGHYSDYSYLFMILLG